MDKTVRIILHKNDLHLAEWQEGGSYHRAWVTPDMFKSYDKIGKSAVVTNPSAGIPYGLDWSRMVTLSATPRDVDRELKNAGIWTAEDLRENPNGARAALQSVYGFDMAALLMAVKEYEN
ncbi:MAG TPA: hypothetical protein VMW58_02485 [Anaerolineae bacterium]|nr:hypothetical protein [Anaerolineae bacterium]